MSICWCYYISLNIPQRTEMKYRSYSRNLRTFFSILAAEKSGCVKYTDFFVFCSRSGFYSSIIENTVRFVTIL
jgi:hypothetical protein